MSNQQQKTIYGEFEETKYENINAEKNTDKPAPPMAPKRPRGRPRKHHVEATAKPKVEAKAKPKVEATAKPEAEAEKKRPRGRPKKDQKKPTEKPAKKITMLQQPEIIWVENEMKRKGRRIFSEEKEETTAVHVFQTNPSMVGFSKKLVKNLGDYESASVNVHVTRPCYVEMEDKTIEDISKAIDKRLTEELLALVQLKRNMEV